MLPESTSPAILPAGTQLCREGLASSFLGRDVELSILLPTVDTGGTAPYPVLYLNYGQDLERIHGQTGK